MEKQFKVITLCGSTKFKKEFEETQKRLTLEGNVVISVGLFGHSGDDEVWTDNKKEMLDNMHRQKIDMADEIFVIDVDGYIGESTKAEIDYAISKGKPVKYYSGRITIDTFKTDIFQLVSKAYELNPSFAGEELCEIEIDLYNKIDKFYEQVTSTKKNSETAEWIEIGSAGVYNTCSYNEYAPIKCNSCGYEPDSHTTHISDGLFHNRWTKEKYCAGCGKYMTNNTTPSEELVSEFLSRN